MNNFYIHKKYPIRFIDNCGFDKGNEAEIISLLTELNNNQSNIIIDDKINQIFGNSDDKKNDIHLILYFSTYNTNYNISTAYLSFMKEQKKKGIPIIFIISKSINDVFKKGGLRSNEIKKIKKARNLDEFNDSKTVFINCLNRKGLKGLFQIIYELFEKEQVKDLDELNKFKYNNYSENEINNIKHKLFFKNIDENKIIKESMKLCAKEIKILIAKLVGKYSKKLNIKTRFFFWFSDLWNYIKKDKKNFFPLLSELVQKIYNIFGKNKSLEICNEYIKFTLEYYFTIDNTDNMLEKINKLKNDFINYRILFWNTNNNFKMKENIENDLFDNEKEFNFNNKRFTDVGKIFIDKEREMLKRVSKEINTIDNYENIHSINKTLPIKDKEENLFSNEAKLDNNNPEKIFKEIRNYIDKGFGINDGKVKINLNKKDKILLKIFFINLVCNKLTSELCREGLTYQTIWDFYYEAAKIYNNAINGFNEIKKEFELNK